MSSIFNYFFIVYLYVLLSAISVLSEPASLSSKEPDPEPEEIFVDNDGEIHLEDDYVNKRSLSLNQDHRHNILTNQIDNGNFEEDPIPPPPPFDSNSQGGNVELNFHKSKILSLPPPPVQIVEEPSFFSWNGLSKAFAPLTDKFDHASEMVARGKQIVVAVGIVLLLAFLKLTVFSWGAKQAKLKNSPREASDTTLGTGYTAAIIEAIEQMAEQMKIKHQ